MKILYFSTAMHNATDVIPVQENTALPLVQLIVGVAAGALGLIVMATGAYYLFKKGRGEIKKEKEMRNEIVSAISFRNVCTDHC